MSAPPQSSRLFGSRVGRRIFLLIAVAALAPLLLTAIISQAKTASELKRTVHETLREDAKSFGMEILANLQTRAELARQIARALDDKNEVSLPAGSVDLISRVWLKTPDGMALAWGHPTNDYRPQSDFEPRRVHNGDVRLARNTRGGSDQWYFIVGSRGSSANMYVMRISEDGMWQPRAYLPYQTAYCIYDADGHKVSCTDSAFGSIPDSVVRSAMQPRSELLEWDQGTRENISAAWTLFLEGEFSHPSLHVIASMDQQNAFRSIAAIQQLLPPLIAGVGALVVLLSLRLIRNNLVPLRQLTEATRAYAAGDSNVRVDVDRKDEFGDLASAFNEMTRQLTRKIEVMRTMSSIDNSILSGTAVDELIQYFLRQLQQIIGAAAVAICREDPDNPLHAELRIRTSDGESLHRLSLANAMRHMETLAVTEESVLPIEATDETVRGIFAKLSIHNVVAMPIMFAGDIHGSVMISMADDEPVQPEIIESCQDLIGRLSIGMASAEREEALYRRAHFDELTSLPNRQLVKDRIAQCIAQAVNHGCRGALLFLDLDRFKSVNDVFGHSTGDVLLREAAQRICSTCDATATVARLGGDEFVILMPEIADYDEAHKLAAAVVKSLGEPFEIQNSDHILGCSIGIAVFPDDGKSVEVILRNSDAAMYRAKDAGRNRYEFFSERLNIESRRRLMLERDLRQALDKQELQLFYQPQFNLADRSIRGAEALLRWQHPEHGWIGPDEFIEIAEQSDLICDIGRWVIDQACRDLRTLLDRNLHPGVVSVNISARQLRDGMLTTDVLAALKSHRINPGFVELEVTETIIAQDKDAAFRILTALQGAGLGIAMDDFGTGYSSLSYLRQLPIDVLKIDRSFVSEIGTDEGAESICRAIIMMAHSLGKSVIAEGIETEPHARFLIAHGCEIGQGYLFSKPVPFSDFERFVRQLAAHTQRRRALEVS